MLDNICALLQIDPQHTINLILSFSSSVPNQKLKVKECVELIKTEEKSKHEKGEVTKEYQILHNKFIDIIIDIDDELIDDDMYIE